MRIDFHVHSNLSPCSIINPKVLFKIAKKKGLDAIAIVNHNKLGNFKSNEVKVINGMEICTSKGEVIGLNIKKPISKGLEPQKTIDEIKKQGGFVIIPHPFDKLRKGVGDEIIKLCDYDAVEVNGRCLFKSFNEKAKAFSISNKVPIVGGSDAHFYEELGCCITQVKADNITEALSNIKKGRSSIIIKRKSLWDHRFYAYSWLAILKKRLILK